MHTIDTSAIEGFDEMTAEKKVEALLGLEIPEKVDLSGYVRKDLFDKTSSELAEAKKTIKSKLTEDEAAAAEREAKWAEMEAEIAQLRREKLESSYRASYLALGYDDALATDSAKAMADGNMARVFENQRKADEASEKRRKAELMKNNPHPGGAGGESKQEEPEGVSLAKKLGRQRRESQTASDEIMKHYMK